MNQYSTDLSKWSFISLSDLFLCAVWPSRVSQVFSNIHRFTLIACLMTIITSPTLHAQEQVETVKGPTAGPDKTEILRLEATIRGNKEQPQVLTIVPWQLPVHQRINENSEWQLQVTQLSSIERNAFLRKLAVVNELKKAQAKPIFRSETASDNN